MKLPSSLLAQITADIVRKVCDKKVAEVQAVIIKWEFDKISSFEAIKKISNFSFKSTSQREIEITCYLLLKRLKENEWRHFFPYLVRCSYCLPKHYA